MTKSTAIKINVLLGKILRSLSHDEVLAGARYLRLLHGKKLYFENEKDAVFLYDYLIYSYRPRGFNHAELYLRTHRDTLDAASMAMLKRMSCAPTPYGEPTRSWRTPG